MYSDTRLAVQCNKCSAFSLIRLTSENKSSVETCIGSVVVLLTRVIIESTVSNKTFHLMYIFGKFECLLTGCHDSAFMKFRWEKLNAHIVSDRCQYYKSHY